jgi:hypothetical protein
LTGLLADGELRSRRVRASLWDSGGGLVVLPLFTFTALLGGILLSSVVRSAIDLAIATTHQGS